ncbi:MAG: hypothetical protein V7767_10430, partial [Leeuwenhoekiella sp.]
SLNIAKTPFAKIYFTHFDDLDTGIKTFKRRYDRIEWNNILYKIDLEKPYYSNEDIIRWNELKLPNSVAFYSYKVLENWDKPIHNGIFIDKWVIDGAKMFDISRNYFNIFKWIKSGRIETSLSYQILNQIIFDPTIPRSLKKGFLKKLSLVKNLLFYFAFECLFQDLIYL